MAGAAPDLGEVLLAGLAGIFGALTTSDQPRQEPIPVAPTITRPPGLGISTNTLILIGVGAFVLVQLLK